ncbi:MAG: beta-glucuronidase [Clostridia bacterium]|nr:beta-glucuronidase [Clostridia bacterium]
MKRAFENSLKRCSTDLCGFWRFAKDENDAGREEKWFLGLPSGEKVYVPSVWNTQMGMLEYEGVCWYQRSFVTEGGALRFCFGAIMTYAEVWLDGDYLGSHYGGFCQFDFIKEAVEAGEHTLTVRVDNSFDRYSIPQATVDWYHYGGITREVCVERLRGVSVLNNKLHYTLSEDYSRAECFFELELYGAEGAGEDTVVASVGEKAVSLAVSVKPGERVTVKTDAFTVDSVRLWSPEEPNLYPINIESSTDGLCDRCGFRHVTVTERGIAINGKVFEVRGVNRHEEHPCFGFAFPESQMQRDIDIIKDLGCNSVRGSHYPNSKTFVDLLDEQGLTFWSEIPIWGCGFGEETLADAAVVERGLDMHREMVKYYYNHPSIIIFGMHNEILTDTDAAVAMSKTYYEYLKAEGGNRIVTYASHLPSVDRCFGYCDIICLNVYYGWYSGPISKWDSFVEEFRERREKLGLSHKPVIFSEFGGAAIYGYHTFDNLRWTEEYQANLLSHCLKLFHRDPMVVGYYVWQFSDIRTSKQMGLNRARSFNNKGLIDEHRRPKLAYLEVRKLNREFKEEENN